MVPSNYSFVACNRASACVESAKPAVVKAYAAKLLNDGSDITAGDEELPSGRRYKKAMQR